jgi:hypothetical protein
MSCGRTGQGRPRRRFSAEEALRTARAALRAWSANQAGKLTKPNKKGMAVEIKAAISY